MAAAAVAVLTQGREVSTSEPHSSHSTERRMSAIPAEAGSGPSRDGLHPFRDRYPQSKHAVQAKGEAEGGTPGIQNGSPQLFGTGAPKGDAPQ